MFDIEEPYADREINGLKFVMTCWVCPEQYDVFDGDKQVAYIRLRGGKLAAYVPDVGGELIYKHYYEDEDLRGCFTDEEDRVFHLTKIAKIVNRCVEAQDGH